MRGRGLIALILGVALFAAPVAGAHEVTTSASVASFDALTFAETSLEHSNAAIATEGAGLRAADTSGDIHSDNFRKLGQSEITTPNGTKARGSDLAFQGRLMVAGT